MTNKENIKKIGEVFWGFGEGGGYVSGLEGIEDKLKGENFERRWFYAVFCTEVAIAVDNPVASQQDPRAFAANLMQRGLIDETDVDYIYSQFGFNSDEF